MLSNAEIRGFSRVYFLCEKYSKIWSETLAQVWTRVFQHIKCVHRQNDRAGLFRLDSCCKRLISRHSHLVSSWQVVDLFYTEIEDSAWKPVCRCSSFINIFYPNKFSIAKVDWWSNLEHIVSIFIHFFEDFNWGIMVKSIFFSLHKCPVQLREMLNLMDLRYKNYTGILRMTSPPMSWIYARQNGKSAHVSFFFIFSSDMQDRGHLTFSFFLRNSYHNFHQKSLNFLAHLCKLHGGLMHCFLSVCLLSVVRTGPKVVDIIHISKSIDCTRKICVSKLAWYWLCWQVGLIANVKLHF